MFLAALLGTLFALLLFISLTICAWLGSMCGRTCLTLQPTEIVKACREKCGNKGSSSTNSKDDIGDLEPEYRFEFNCGRKYCPSYNIAPTDITPVLVSSSHFYDEKDTEKLKTKRIVVPMMWGMIPFWHKGDWRKHRLTTNNCRLEHMMESKLYQGAFQRGQRCVVLCEGFYEWQTTNTAKPSERAAHLLYMPQKEGIKIYDRSTWNSQDVNLLKMAGLFDIWMDENGDKMYSYSIITFESSEIMSWLHHRMPAILESEEQINDWLDFKNISNEEAMKALRPAGKLLWYRVSNMVNNSRNKSDQCNKPLEIIRMQKPIMNKLMSSWLNVEKRKLSDRVLKNNQISGSSDAEPEVSAEKRRCLL